MKFDQRDSTKYLYYSYIKIQTHAYICTVYGFSILLLLLSPAAQAQVGKTKLFINCLRNPTSTCATEKL